MLGFAARMIGGAIAPLIDRITTVSARLLRKAALLFVAALCLLVVVVALTVAFFLWIASLASPIIAALAVAGVYFAVAALALIFALRDGSTKAESAGPSLKDTPKRQAEAGINAQIDQFTAPLMDLLARFGFRREQLAVLAGASMAKQLGPLPLVGLAIVGGFLIGRMWKTWRSLLSLDLITSVLASDLFGLRQPRGDSAGPEEA